MDVEQTTRSLLSAIPMAVVLIGADDRISAASPAALEQFGSAITGRLYGLVFRHPELLAAIAAARQGTVQRLRHIQSGVQEQIFNVTISATDAGVLCAFEDLSAIAQIDQMRRDFVANVSHELRTPLTSVLGFIETLRGAARDDKPARERFLGIMASEAERMNRLVRDLLHLSRVEAEERIRPSGEVDLAGLLRSTLSSLRPLAESGRIAVQTTGLDAPQLLRADPDQMTQVMTNLIENAMKYGSPAGSTLRITLVREDGPRGPQLRFSVQDEGEGIAAIHIPRLTERFYRVDGHRSREKGGTGLGLAIVKHIVNRHRGRLLIDSEPGKGSVFTVILPVG